MFDCCITNLEKEENNSHTSDIVSQTPEQITGIDLLVQYSQVLKSKSSNNILPSPVLSRTSSITK
jgi:hypothetical protein